MYTYVLYHKLTLQTQEISLTDGIPPGWMGLDVGPKTNDEYKLAILSAKTTLWNGLVMYTLYNLHVYIYIYMYIHSFTCSPVQWVCLKWKSLQLVH